MSFKPNVNISYSNVRYASEHQAVQPAPNSVINTISKKSQTTLSQTNQKFSFKFAYIDQNHITPQN